MKHDVLTRKKVHVVQKLTTAEQR